MNRQIKTIPLVELCTKLNPYQEHWECEQCSVETFDWIKAFADTDISVSMVYNQTLQLVMATSDMMLHITKVIRSTCSSFEGKGGELKVSYLLTDDGECIFDFDVKTFMDSVGDISETDLKVVEALVKLLYTCMEYTLIDFREFLVYLTEVAAVGAGGQCSGIVPATEFFMADILCS